MHLDEGTTQEDEVGTEEVPAKMTVWGMLRVDGAGITSRPPAGLTEEHGGSCEVCEELCWWCRRDKMENVDMLEPSTVAKELNMLAAGQSTTITISLPILKVLLLIMPRSQPTSSAKLASPGSASESTARRSTV